MGYLSCRAESAVSVSNSQTPSDSHEKPIKIQHFDYSDLVAATNGFSDQKLLGKGSHGYVYKAVLRGRLVAVKRPSRAHSKIPRPTSISGPEATNEVDNEIEILSKIQSPRLVNLLGFSNDTRDRLLVVEFMSNGTLYDVLHSSNANNKPPSWGRRIRLALQTAKAIDILHSSNPPVIHRDIKSANVLIDRSYNARLGDFGLALRCHLDDYKLRSTPPAGTMGYLDPCYVTPDNLSTKTDVFSFGILLLEIISGRKAIDVGFSPPSIVDWAIPLIKRGKLTTVYDPRIVPPKEPVVRKQLAVIAAKCVRSCRERRPSMKEIVVWLTGLSKLVPLHSWNNFNNPCTMVETMGQPVESRTSQMNLKPHGFGEGNFESMCENKITFHASLFHNPQFRKLLSTTQSTTILNFDTQQQQQVKPYTNSLPYLHSLNIVTLLLKLRNHLIPHPDPQLLSLLLKLLVLQLLLIVQRIFIRLNEPFRTNCRANHTSLGHKLFHCFFVSRVWKLSPLIQVS